MSLQTKEAPSVLTGLFKRRGGIFLKSYTHPSAFTKSVLLITIFKTFLLTFVSQTKL
jgi:hypothetical protein